MSSNKTVDVSRRSFVKILGGTAALSVAGIGLEGCGPQQVQEQAPVPFTQKYGGQVPEASIDLETGNLVVNEDILVRYSSCLGCYSSCGNRVKIDRTSNRIMSVGGNPYNPDCAYPYLNFDEPLSEAYLSMSQASGKGNVLRGTLCNRGNATFDAYHQPDRITTPLKRAGKRGEGKWISISWDQLIQDVTGGGKLFEDLGEDQEIEGFSAIRDTTTPMDAASPEFGPLSNQLVMFGGRGDGRAFVASRFASCFGSVNNYGHGSSCGGAKNVNVFSKGANDLRTDIENAEYILWIGCFPGANGKSMQGIANRCTAQLQKGTVLMDVVDPALGNGIVTPAQKNVRWLPIRTATNTAFVLGMIRWIIENETFNKDFVSFPSYQAALDGGYASFSNATHLVIMDENHANYRKLMRAADAGIAAPEPKDPKKPEDHYVVIDSTSNEPSLHKESSSALIDYEGEVEGIKVRSTFLFLKDAAFEHSIDEFAALCEVQPEDIIRIAKEFTSHGTKASATGMGSTATINGLDSACIYSVLDSLIGSDLMKGGMVPRRSGAKTTGDGERYALGTIEGKPELKAAMVSRTGMGYEKTSEYIRKKESGDTTPPQLPWFAIPGASDNQALLSVANAYPYQTKIMLTWMANPLQACPGAIRDSILEKLKDPAIVPLAITCDVFMGEMASISDYIVPDTTPYESFGIVTQEGYFNGKGNSVRWPVTDPESELLSDGRHASYEAFVCEIAQTCKLPGFGEDALKSTDGKTYPFNDACDLFLKGVANLAYDTEPVNDIEETDIHLQALDALPEAWRAAVTEEEWPKVLKVLSRGGRFWPIDEAFEDEKSSYGTEFMTTLYSEKRAMNINSLTQERSHGTMRWTPELFSDLTPIEDRFPRSEWPFTSTQYKAKYRSISMLSNSPLMRDIASTNYLEINGDDAIDLGIADGDIIAITNPTGDIMRGEAMVRGGIAKGTFAVAFGYGHFAYGSQAFDIDGTATPGDSAIGAGIHLQTMLDPTVAGIFPVSDPEAATPGRCGGVYKIAKV